MRRLILLVIIFLGCTGSSWAGGWGHGGYRHGGYHYGGYYYGGDYALALISGMVIGGMLSHFASTQRPQTVIVKDSNTTVVPNARQVVRKEFSACVMTREYTTVISIDGKERDAYGTRCMKPDGSWVLGAPKLVPEFN